MISTRATTVFVLALMLTMHVQSKSCGRAELAKSSNINANRGVQSATSEPKPSANRQEQPPVPEKTHPNAVKNSTDKITAIAKQREVPLGKWGGEHIRLVVREDGADIEYDCAHGSIVGKLSLDGARKFILTGTHVREGPGPIRIGVPRTSRPARYDGEVNGDEMTLTVTLTDKAQEAGSFSLRRGSEGRIRKCR